MTHRLIYPLLLACLLPWAIAASPAAAACNDLVVDIDQNSPWRFVEPDDDACTHGDVEEFTDRRIFISGDLLAGPQCDLTLRRGDGTRATLEVDQNLCGAEAGRIAVRYRSGPQIPFCSQEGSAGNGRNGRITFGDTRWQGSPGSARELRLVTYNVFDRPYAVVQDGQDARMERLPAALQRLHGGIDAIVFQEAFNGDVLRYGLCRAGMRHQTPILTDPTPASAQNGGVFIASPWPITRTGSAVYRGACSGADCLAAKGVVYARVEKRAGGSASTFHVFGTHLQAGADESKDRQEQAKQLRAFVDRQHIPASEPVLIAGDFNEDAAHHPGKVRALAQALRADLPQIPNGVYTSNPDTNELVGLDGAADDGGCCGPYLASQPHRCGCCPKEFLDLVFTAQGHRPPASQLELTMVPLTSHQRFDACITPYKCKGILDGCSNWKLRDYSDHYPVLTTYRF